MTTWVYRPGHPEADEHGFVEKEKLGPRTSSASPHVISDYLPDLRHPITGKQMDSKSAFRAVTRAHGCEEVGNEKQVDRRTFDVGNRKADIARAIEQLGG